jgi:hypothetical protein
MKTIKIFLNDDGSIKKFSQDFKINQYSFQDTLLNVYVPTNIIDLAMSYNLTDSETIIYGTSIQMGLVYTNSNGSTKVGDKYLFSYVKDLSVEGVSYQLFERLMPKEFTLYDGTNTYAINVVNTKTTIDGDISTTVATNLITSGTYSMEITKSVNFGNETEETSDYDNIISQLNALVSKLEAKQDKTDNDLTTTTKNLIEAINSINSLSTSNASQITINTASISTNASNIQWLTDNMAVNETSVGYVEKETEPNATDLDAYVKEVLSRDTQLGDAVIWTYLISGETDISYKCSYTSDGWGWVKIPTVESASNNDKGILKGNLNDTYAPIRLDISSGEVKGVYVRDDILNENGSINTTAIAGTSQCANSTLLSYVIAALTCLVQKGFEWTNETLLDDSIPKAKIALKAECDENGSNISETYMTNTNGVSKQWVKDYALPRDFNDTSYITSEGYVDDIPSKTDPQFTNTTSSVGYSTIFELSKIIDSEFELTKKNSAKTSIYIKSNRDTQIQLLLTNTFKTETATYSLSSTLSGVLALTANGITKVDFDNEFALLNSEIQVKSGNSFIQKLEILATESATTIFEVYSNETYPSSFNLNTFTQINYVEQGELGEFVVVDLQVDTTKTISSTSVSFVSNADITLHKNCNVMFNFNDLLDYKDTIGVDSAGKTVIGSITINGVNYSFVDSSKTLQDLNNLYTSYTADKLPFTYLITKEINSVLFLDDFCGSVGNALWTTGTTSDIIKPKADGTTLQVNNLTVLGDTHLTSPNISGVVNTSAIASSDVLTLKGTNEVEIYQGDTKAIDITSNGVDLGMNEFFVTQINNSSGYYWNIDSNGWYHGAKGTNLMIFAKGNHASYISLRHGGNGWLLYGIGPTYNCWVGCDPSTFTKSVTYEFKEDGIYKDNELITLTDSDKSAIDKVNSLYCHNISIYGTCDNGNNNFSLSFTLSTTSSTAITGTDWETLSNTLASIVGTDRINCSGMVVGKTLDYMDPIVDLKLNALDKIDALGGCKQDRSITTFTFYDIVYQIK